MILADRVRPALLDLDLDAQSATDDVVILADRVRPALPQHRADAVVQHKLL